MAAQHFESKKPSASDQKLVAKLLKANKALESKYLSSRKESDLNNLIENYFELSILSHPDRLYFSLKYLEFAGQISSTSNAVSSSINTIFSMMAADEGYIFRPEDLNNCSTSIKTVLRKGNINHLKTTGAHEFFLELWLEYFRNKTNRLDINKFNTEYFSLIARTPLLNPKVAYKALVLHALYLERVPNFELPTFILKQLIISAKAYIASTLSQSNRLSRNLMLNELELLSPYNIELALLYFKEVQTSPGTYNIKDEILIKILLHFPELIDTFNDMGLGSKFHRQKTQLEIIMAIMNKNHTHLDINDLYKKDILFFTKILSYSHIIFNLLQQNQIIPFIKGIDGFLEDIIKKLEINSPDLITVPLKFLKKDMSLFMDYFFQIFMRATSKIKLTANFSQEITENLGEQLPSAEECQRYLVMLMHLIIANPKVFEQIKPLFDKIISSYPENHFDLVGNEDILKNISPSTLKELPKEFFSYILQLFKAEKDWFSIFKPESLKSLPRDICGVMLTSNPTWQNLKLAVDRFLISAPIFISTLKNIIIEDVDSFLSNEFEVATLAGYLLGEDVDPSISIFVAKKYPKLSENIYTRGNRKNKFTLEQQKELAKLDIDLAVKFINDLTDADISLDTVAGYLEEIGNSFPDLCYSLAQKCEEIGKPEVASRLYEQVPENSEEFKIAQISYYTLLIRYLNEAGKEENAEKICKLFEELKQLIIQKNDNPQAIADNSSQSSYKKILTTTTNISDIKKSENTPSNNNNEITLNSNNGSSPVNSQESEAHIKAAKTYSELPAKEITTLTALNFICKKYNIKSYKWFTSKVSQDTFQKAMATENGQERFKILQEYMLDQNNHQRDLYLILNEFFSENFGEDFFKSEGNDLVSPLKI